MPYQQIAFEFLSACYEVLSLHKTCKTLSFELPFQCRFPLS